MSDVDDTAQFAGVTSRQPAGDDAEAIAALFGDCSQADGVERPDYDEIRAWLEDEDGPDRRVWLEDRELTAYSDIALWEGAAWLDLAVRPPLRGSELEKQLLGWNVARASELAPARAIVQRRVSAVDEAGLTASEQMGFSPVGRSYLMSIELQEPPAPAAPPAGIVLRRFRAGEERAVWETQQDAFRDASDHVDEVSFEAWHEDRIDHASFDPSLWTVAEAGGEMAGVALARFRNDHGWIGILGVHRPWRGRGLGAALLRESFRLFWDRGERVISLSVDAKSPTGAVDLYERAGMTIKNCVVTLERPLT